MRPGSAGAGGGEGPRTDRKPKRKTQSHILRELPKRLARRLLDLQFLPYIVVINPVSAGGLAQARRRGGTGA